MGRSTLDLPLVGAGGEPVDLWRTLVSHGVAELPPARIDADARTMEITLPLAGGAARTVRIGPQTNGHAPVEILGGPTDAATRREVGERVRFILRLDDDLSDFYTRAREDPALAWATQGAGRLLRSPTVFEDVVKTVCTTNCTWSATERMVGALVEHLGEPAPGAPASGPYGRAFPTPLAMAGAPDDFYREVARTGYRGAYLRSLAASVAEATVDLEGLGRASPDDVSDDEVAALLLALPGVGPYAAAHVMMLLGRYSRLVLDSWTRPKYARINGGRPVKDTTIVRRFRRYGPYAGLAFWLVLTRDWVDDS